MSDKTILIVEDEVIIAEYLKELLSSVGFSQVEMVHDAVDAESYLNKFLVDLILLDINMSHQLSGINLALEYLAEKHIPFIYITGSSNAGTIDSALETQPAALITKPFKSADVIAAVKIALSKTQINHTTQQNERPVSELVDINTINQEEGSCKLSQFEIDRMREIVQICRRNCSEASFNTELLAGEARMSRRQLYRFTEKSFNTTPAQLIKEHRLKLAKEYISVGKYKRVKDLAFQCGFLKTSHFSKEFEKFYGEKPSLLIRDR